jgi:hypothetical protein
MEGGADAVRKGQAGAVEGPALLAAGALLWALLVLAPPPRIKWTRRVPHPVIIGHAASLTQVLARAWLALPGECVGWAC